MYRTVDHIPYLCCVADTKKFHGFYSSEFTDWEKKIKMEFIKSNSEDYEKWLIEKFIPFHNEIPKTDMDCFTLPKVFRTKYFKTLKTIEYLADRALMSTSINLEKNIMLVL